MNKIPYLSDEKISYLTLEEVCVKCTQNNDIEKLYHFTSFDSFVKIWLSKKLLFSKRARMNDVAEKYDMIIGDDVTKMQAYLYAIGEYRQISLSEKGVRGDEIFRSSLMWAFYAQNATGVCIELDKEKLISCMSNMTYKKITYVENIPNNSLLRNEELNAIASIDDARLVVDSNMDKIFFEKSKEWQYENEFRIISRIEDYIDISDCITSVYVFDPDLATREMIYNLVDNNVKITVVFISSILRNERYTDTFTLSERFLKKASSCIGDFDSWLKNDKRKNFK